MEQYLIYNNLAAFLAVHATCHNAGVGHDHIVNPVNQPAYFSPYNGFMSSGCCMTRNYLGRVWPSCECNSSSGDHFTELETFVSETSYNFIKDAFYERFIK